MLATENITVETRKIATACFDLKNRTLIVPDWEGVSDSGYDLLLGHEVGHALDTPYDAWTAVIDEKPSLKQFLNVVEDSRIEKRIKRRYPGLRKSFFKGYSEFFEKDLFGLKDRDVNDLFFVDRLNIYCKVGSLISIDFTPEELELVKLVESTETFEEVVIAAKAVYDYSKVEQEEKKKEDTGTEESDTSGEGEEKESDDVESLPAESNEDGESGEESSDGEKSDDDAETSSEKKASLKNVNPDGEPTDEEDGTTESGSVSTKEGLEGNDIETESTKASSGVDGSGKAFEPYCETDENFENLRAGLASLGGKNFVYVKYPTPDLKKIVTPIKRVHELLKQNFTDIPEYVVERTTDFKNRNSRYIDLLAKEFEMRKAAKSYAKTKVSSTGDIDIGKIYKYRTDDNIFRKSSITPKGKNHGMIILLDRSGSMGDNMKNSLEQLVIMAQFCKRVGVPFVVYGFGDNKAGYLIDHQIGFTELTPTFTTNRREIFLKSVYLREYLNSNMTKVAFTEACNNIITLASLYEYSYDRRSVPVQEQLSSTPLNEALLSLAPIAKEFKTKNGLEIVSTVIIQDGDADTFSNLYGTGEENNQGRAYFNPYHDTLIVSEKINGKVFQKKIAGDASNPHSFNDSFLEYYSQYTDTKVVGIFLMNHRQTRSVVDAIAYKTNKFIPYDKRTKLKTELKTNQFLAVQLPGYNKFFYVIGGSNMSDNTEISIDSDMTVSKIKSAFLKNNQKKLTNRLLVAQLVAEISA